VPQPSYTNNKHWIKESLARDWGVDDWMFTTNVTEKGGHRFTAALQYIVSTFEDRSMPSW
jgi:hypothetical protein